MLQRREWVSAPFTSIGRTAKDGHVQGLSPYPANARTPAGNEASIIHDAVSSKHRTYRTPAPRSERVYPRARGRRFIASRSGGPNDVTLDEVSFVKPCERWHDPITVCSVQLPPQKNQLAQKSSEPDFNYPPRQTMLGVTKRQMGCVESRCHAMKRRLISITSTFALSYIHTGR